MNTSQQQTSNRRHNRQGSEAKTKQNTSGESTRRFASLSDALTPRTDPAGDQPSPEPGENTAPALAAPDPDTAARDAATDPNRGRQPARSTNMAATPQPVSQTADGGTVNLGFYLPGGLRDQLREHASTHRRSQVNLLLDAVEATVDDIPAALRARQQPAPTGLFRRPSSDESVGGGPTMNMRIPADTVATIDRLATQAGARSRSEYLRTALELHFQ